MVGLYYFCGECSIKYHNLMSKFHYVLLMVLAVMMLGFNAYSQDPDDQVPVKTVYAQILGINKNVLGIGNKISVEIDFGDENFFWGNDGRNEVVDENGKEIKFNTMVDAMNFMGELGWEFKGSYVITIANQNVIHFLLSKKIRMDEDLREGVLQKRDFKKPKEKKPVDRKSDPLYD